MTGVVVSKDQSKKSSYLTCNNVMLLPLTVDFAGNVNFVPPPFCSFGEGWGEVLDVALELFELDLVD